MSQKYIYNDNAMIIKGKLNPKPPENTAGILTSKHLLLLIRAWVVHRHVIPLFENVYVITYPCQYIYLRVTVLIFS
jgi:hypothetical protein